MLTRSMTLALVFACFACAEDQDTAKSGVVTRAEPSGQATMEVDGQAQTLRVWDASFNVYQEDGDLDTLEIILTAANADEGSESLSVMITKTKQLERGPVSLAGDYETRDAAIRLNGSEVESAGATLTIASHAVGKITGSIDFDVEDSEIVATFEGPIAGTCHKRSGDGWKAEPITDEFCAQYFQ